MKSPGHRGHKKGTIQPVTSINDTKYIGKLSERTIPKTYYTTGDDYEKDDSNHFLNLYGIVCMYIFSIIAIIIGGGGIAVCIYYFNAVEDTKNWKIGGIALGAATCIITVILIILTIFKQTHNRPWRYQVKDILLRPDYYFYDDIDQFSSGDLDDDDGFQDTINDQKNQTVDTTPPSAANPSMGLLKTVHNDLVYCLGCNRLHPSTEECLKPRGAPKILPPLKRSRSLHGLQKSEEYFRQNKSHSVIDQSIKYSLSNETQTDVLGNTADNLILRRMPLSMTKVISQQATTKIMIVRVPKVPGELVLQPKEH